MKKQIKTEMHGKFLNSRLALMAAQLTQMYFVSKGYLVGSYMCLETKSLEVTVHMESPEDDMTLPMGYLASEKQYNEFASSVNGKMIYTTEFYFRY